MSDTSTFFKRFGRKEDLWYVVFPNAQEAGKLAGFSTSITLEGMHAIAIFLSFDVFIVLFIVLVLLRWPADPGVP